MTERPVDKAKVSIVLEEDMMCGAISRLVVAMLASRNIKRPRSYMPARDLSIEELEAAKNAIVASALALEDGSLRLSQRLPNGMEFTCVVPKGKWNLQE
jgi:hypothetical protein